MVGEKWNLQILVCLLVTTVPECVSLIAKSVCTKFVEVQLHVFLTLRPVRFTPAEKTRDTISIGVPRDAVDAVEKRKSLCPELDSDFLVVHPVA